MTPKQALLHAIDKHADTNVPYNDELLELIGIVCRSYAESALAKFKASFTGGPHYIDQIVKNEVLKQPNPELK